MNTKRISAELAGDSAIRADIIYTSTRLSAEPKKDADRMFCELSTLCVERIIELCKKETGVQFPSYSQLHEYLTGQQN